MKIISGLEKFIASIKRAMDSNAVKKSFESEVELTTVRGRKIKQEIILLKQLYRDVNLNRLILDDLIRLMSDRVDGIAYNIIACANEFIVDTDKPAKRKLNELARNIVNGLERFQEVVKKQETLEFSDLAPLSLFTISAADADDILKFEMDESMANIFKDYVDTLFDTVGLIKLRFIGYTNSNALNKQLPGNDLPDVHLFGGVLGKSYPHSAPSSPIKSPRFLRSNSDVPVPCSQI